MRYIRTRADTTDMRLLRVSKDAIGTVIAFLTATAAQQSVVFCLLLRLGQHWKHAWHVAPCALGDPPPQTSRNRKLQVTRASNLSPGLALTCIGHDAGLAQAHGRQKRLAS